MSLPASDALTSVSQLGLATYSANWTIASGTIGDIIVHAGGAFCGTAGHSPEVFWNADTFPNDQFSQLTFNSGGLSTAYLGPAVRSSANNWYHFAVHATGADFLFEKFVAGTYTNVSGVITHSFSNGDILKITAVGTTVSLYQNGTVIYSTGDPSLASGSAGFGFFDANTSELPSVKTWSGGAATSQMGQCVYTLP